jgi:deazaflavin-dependent oxidoreductase (nitroreductase family)
MAAAPPNWIVKTFTGAHVLVYRLSKGKLGGTIAGFPLLLLTTTGRKSGRARTTPVAYLRSGGEYLISASAGGADTHPAWFYNLQSKPEAKIEVDGQTFNVKVTIAEGAERDRLYEQFKAKGQNFVQYEQRTRRIIPVICLQPLSL